MGRRYDDDDRYERRRPDPDSLHRRDAEEGRLRRGRYSDSKEGGSPPRRRDRDDDHKRHPDGRDNDIKMKGSPSRTDRDRDRRHRERDSRFNDSEEDDRHMRHGDGDRDRKRRSGSRGNNGKLRENSPRPPNRDKERQQEPSRSSTESGEASPLRKSKDQHGDRRQHLGARETVSKPREDKHSRERGKEIGRQEQSRSSIESGEVSPARKPLDKQGDRRQHLNGRDNISKPREDSSSQQGRGKKRAVPESSRNFTESGGATPKKSMDKHGDHRRHSDGRDIISKPTEDSPRREHSRSSTESGEASPPRKSTDKHNDRRRHSDVRNTIRKRREDSPSRQERDKERGRRGQESSSSYSEEDSPPRRSGGKVDHRRRGRSRSFSDSEEDSSPRRSRGKAARQRRERTVSSSDSEGNSPPRRSRGKEDNRRHRDREERLNRHDREDMVRRDEKPNPNGEAKTTTMEDGITGNPPDSAEQLPPPPPLPDMGRSGGVYIPPFKLARMMREVQDKSGEAYQRMSWDALRKSINGLVNKVNATNIKNIIPELFAENLIRGRGLFCRSCMKSQMASPGFTDVFAALVAVVNTKFPDVGKLLLNRIVLQLKRAYKRNDKPQLLAATKFIAHLVNQQVAHEIIALQLLIVLLEKPTDDSVEVAVGFIKECGSLLQDLSPQGLHGIFERFRGILHEGEIDKRVQFLIEGLFAIRKAKFEGFPAVRPELDLVDVEDQFTHEVSLEDEIDPETTLDIFKPNPQFLEDEKAYENLKRNILGAESSEDEGESDDGEDDEDEDDDESDEESEDMAIKDETETNLINLRRTIYLTIMSSVEFEEAGHKLLKIKLEPGQEMELCIMLLECCSQERTYLRYYGLLGQRFCLINKVHQENFEKCFVQQYSMIHRLETNKLRNVAKFFAHLLGTDALPWHVLAYIRLTEEDTTSSSRIFIKILFQELSEHLGIRLLNERLNEPTMQDSFESIFPKDNPKNTRFAINFFTSIGLGGITESLREYLRNMPRLIMQQQKAASSDDDSGSSGSSSSGSDSGTSSETDSDSDSDSHSSESEKRRKRRKR